MAEFCESEIEELYLTAGRHQNVRRFQIAMNDAFCVRGLKGRRNLQGECESFRWRNGKIFLLFGRNNRTAIDKLHHDVIRANVINLADIGMVECGNRSGFASEALAELGGGKLDCNR